MAEDSAILVVGADGLIGRALAERLAREKQPLVQTVLQKGDITDIGNKGAEISDVPLFLALDLARDAASWRPPRPVSVAYLCAAVTSQEYCRRHPRESRAVNVAGTLTLARRLAVGGARIVFLSSNLVLDGAAACQRADTPLRPQCEYGRQKAEVERELRELPGACIVRLTKVLGPAAPRLAEWATALAAGRPVRPLADLRMAPVPLGFVVEVLLRLAAVPLEGVVQVSAAEDITYEQAARHIARRLAADPSLVQPLTAAAAGLDLEHLPAHTTLDTTRLRTELGLAPPDVWAAVEIGVGYASA
jgi:dTDP-4-dehydrorhamnose reductase